MRRHHDHRPALLVGALVAGVVLAGCHAPARLGVPTTVVAPTGSCDTSSVVEVGAALPLSGPLAALGHAELTGLELGVAQVNQARGVTASHRCLELLYKDDRSDPAVDGQAILDLANRERVAMVVGPFLALDEPASGAHLGALGVTAASFSSAAGTFSPRSYPYTFPVGSSFPAEARVLAAYAERQRWARVTVLGSGSLTADQGVSAFITAASRAGVEVRRDRHPIGTGPGAAAIMAAARTTHPDALVVFDDGWPLAPLLSARRSSDPSVPLVVAGAPTTPDVPAADRSGVDVVEPAALTVRHSVPSDLASFRTRVLHALHRRSLDGTLTPYGQGYDAVEMFANAANGVNATDPGSLQTYLENANYQGLLGSYNYTSGAHTGLAGSQLTVVPLAAFSNGIFVSPPSG